MNEVHNVRFNYGLPDSHTHALYDFEGNDSQVVALTGTLEEMVAILNVLNLTRKGEFTVLKIERTEEGYNLIDEV